jgi:hypothetical protein
MLGNPHTPALGSGQNHEGGYMSAFFAVLMTMLQLIATGYAYVTQNEPLFADMAVNGHPINLMMNLFNPGSPIIDGKPIYLAFLMFHILKYGIILRSRIVDDHPQKTLIAILFEAVYLSIGAYYTF